VKAVAASTVFMKSPNNSHFSSATVMTWTKSDSIALPVERAEMAGEDHRFSSDRNQCLTDQLNL
tara:strand:- start:205 stop:396 length:192 start_codon:yes stop_codon:yes gene_type:complete